LQALAEGPVDLVAPRQPQSTAIPGEELTRRPSGPPLATISIGIHPTRDLLRRAIDFQSLFTLLDSMGRLTVSTRLDALPALADLNPADCYLSFDIRLFVEERYARRVIGQASTVLHQHLRPNEFALKAGAADAPGKAA
jgi:hypothetical protein